MIRFPRLLLAALLLLPAAPLRAEGPAPAPPAAPAPSKAPVPGLPYAAAVHGKGRLEVLPSGLAVLHLEGTPEEMGEQHGALLREPVQALVRDYLPGILRGAREEALAKARLLEKSIPERLRREMAALAKAAEVPYDDILLGTVVVELFGLNQCSGAAASGPATADGRTVAGRNLEWPDRGVLGRYGLLVAARPEGRKPFLSVGFPAFTGVVTGMNGDGVLGAELVVMNAPPLDREAALKGVPYPILLRMLLEECGSLEEAVKFVRGNPRTVAQNLLLADPSGGMVLECGPGRCEERRQREGLVVVTNYYDEASAPQEFDQRYAGLCASFAAADGGKVDADSMEKAIRGASSHPLAAAMNLQCCVFEPALLRARISVGKPPASRRPMTEVDGAKLLGVTAPADRKDGKEPR
jgi:isopenicillin-N N-acyltransferase like protein